MRHVGSGALQDNVDGIDNTAVGFQALELNVSAFTNAAAGYFRDCRIMTRAETEPPFSTRLSAALRSTLTLMAPSNTAVGAGALENANGGNNNTAVGEIAGLGITTHSNIIAIGHGVSGVDSALGEVDNACYIGNISGASVAVGTASLVIVDASGKLGTVTVDANGTKVTIPGLVSQVRICPKPFPNASSPKHWPRPQASHAQSQGRGITSNRRAPAKAN